jgi:hypothetical protein
MRDYSEPEAGLGGRGPSGELFEDAEEHLAGAIRTSGGDSGPNR